MASKACVFCGSSAASVPVVFPVTFTAYQLLQAGDQACPRCAKMFVDPSVRRNSWVLRKGKFEVLRDPLESLRSLPEPPFVLYLTFTRRKHGWIRAVQNPVLGKDRFILVVDEDKILFDAERFAGLYAFVRNLYARRIPKTVMLGGMPLPSVHRKLGLSWEECFRLQKLQHDPLWRIVGYC